MRRWTSSPRLLSALAVLVAVVATMAAPAGGSAPDDPGARGLERAIAAQERHTESLLARDGVVGTGVGVSGDPVVVVLVERAGVRGVPRSLDGIPVEVRVTGTISALHHCKGKHATDPGCESPPPDPDPDPGPDPDPVDATVTVGQSTGNANECSAGTIGAPVVKNGTTYLLSNNHVFARSNAASIGEDIVAPGRLDDDPQCGSSTVVADLSDYEKIQFNRRRTNTVDAAIAAIRPGVVASSDAPSYGTVSGTTADAQVGLPVQKHGRTTGHTTGSISVINATVDVSYGPGQTARFVDQIVVSQTNSSFLDSGDSGSLLVTASGNNPVGLLFAGSSSAAIANPIDDVLAAFGVAFP